MSLVHQLLPSGQMLPGSTWRHRHRVVVAFALLQVGVVLATAVSRLPSAGVPTAVAVLSLLACVTALVPDVEPRARTVLAALSLAAGPMVLASLEVGVAVAHLQVLVVVAVVALYEDWRPFGTVVGSMSVFYLVQGVTGEATTGATAADTWSSTGVNVAFFLVAATTSLAAWRLHEDVVLRDAVTGLGSRTRFQQLTTAAARGSAPFGVVFIDLDDFKTVNDTHGHDVGDQLLTAVGRRLAGCLRATDTLARLGGDEFAAIVHARPREVEEAASRMLRSLAAPVVVGEVSLEVGASMGVAGLDVTRRPADLPAGARSRGAVVTAQARRDVTALLRDADVALYAAKDRGKNCVVVYAPGMTDLVRRLSTLQQDLRHALERGEIEVHFQPVVEMDTGHVRGYEALARWQHRTAGPVSPAEFIAWAEADRSIGALGAHVLDVAVERAARWTRQTGRPIQMGVNVSPVQLVTPGWAETVRRSLLAHGLPPTQLVLEVTENLVADQCGPAVEALASLRADGVRVAIDDFGTGFSNFEYLRRLPVDVIKIDRSFVAEVACGRTTATVVSAIVHLAGSLGAEVIAEGVETPDQRDALVAMGCIGAQGFLFARPAPGPQHEPALALVTPGPLT
ncbi:MAG: bifunctional diguanylate cyclase/phosphodiesterase [Nocardioidaceae bacterium]|nr:bifunctional diguanylate cyclase/phosphodiesterase [Nocardioidaceae bacterium]